MGNQPRVITTRKVTHLLRHDGQPGEHGLSVAAVTACGREVTGYAGYHAGGYLPASVACRNCHRTSAFRDAADAVWVAEHAAEIAQAESYVRSRFYPPLPTAYGELAVRAVHAVNEGDPYAELDVTGIDPQPAAARDGKVTAARLVSALRLSHLIDDEASDIAYLD